MNLQLENKTVLVSGSTSGIGLAIATRLSQEGARVIVNGRTQERVQHAINTSGATDGIAADLGTEAGVRATISRFRSVDILVNNLAIFEPKPFEEIPDHDWLRFFEVNVATLKTASTREYDGIPGSKPTSDGTSFKSALPRATCIQSRARYLVL